MTLHRLTRLARTTMAPLVIVLVLSGGCANQSKNRVSMLENTNRDLTMRLNELRAEMNGRSQSQGDLARQLAAAQGEIDALNLQLTQIPEAAAPAPGWTDTPSGAMIAIDSSVLFAPGKPTLRKNALRALDGIVSTLGGEYSDQDIIVFGHTDNQPIKKSGWQDNWQLSTERSLAVVRYLESKGINASRLAASGCSEFRPRTSNDVPSNRSQNRRVAIFVVDPQLGLGRPTP